MNFISSKIEHSTSLRQRTDKNLGHLLQNNDDVFLQIIQHVKDHGLHEIRLVNHHWNRLASEIDVSVKKVPIDKFSRIVDLFPNTSHASLINEETENLDQQTMPRGDISFFTTLFSLTKLTSFEAQGFYGYLIWDINMDLETFGESLMRLKALNIEVGFESDSTCHNFFSTLRFMTSLRSLALKTRVKGLLDVEPYHELSLLKSLYVPDNLTNKNGQLLFPSPKLKKLRFLEIDTTMSRFPGGSLEVSSFPDLYFETLLDDPLLRTNPRRSSHRILWIH